jgi:hypothetical protein
MWRLTYVDFRRNVEMMTCSDTRKFPGTILEVQDISELGDAELAAAIVGRAPPALLPAELRAPGVDASAAIEALADALGIVRADCGNASLEEMQAASRAAQQAFRRDTEHSYQTGGAGERARLDALASQLEDAREAHRNARLATPRPPQAGMATDRKVDAAAARQKMIADGMERWRQPLK